jgi:integrase/recombinase XerC
MNYGPFLDTFNRSTNTVKTYRLALSRFLSVVGGDAQPTTETYIKFLKSIRNLSPSTQRVYSSVVIQFFEFIGAGHEQELKAARKHYTRGEGERFPTFNRPAIEQVLKYCSTLSGDLPNLRDRAFVLTLADTGLRIAEACALRRGDIDWQEAISVIIGKGDKQAVIRFSNRAVQALRDYLAARAEMDGTSGRPLTSLPLFARHDVSASRKIKPIAAGGMWCAIKARIEQAGCERDAVRIHDFRHYFVSQIYASTLDIMVTKELARHASVGTTQRYAHLVGKLGEVYDKVFNHANQ